MRYIGGKSKIAKQIAETILSIRPEREHYLEPFIGGGAVFAKMAPHFERPVAGDVQVDLCLMWDAVFNDGWLPPDSLSEDDYEALKTSDASPLRGFAAFGCSFGGKWFGGYARGGNSADGSPRNHQGESSRAVAKIASSVNRSVRIHHADYRQWSPIPGTVVYCDPPYANSQGYVSGDFDSSEFWKVVEGWASSGSHVFVSEYAAPAHWNQIWSSEKLVTLKKTTDDGGRQVKIERLFHLA